MNNDQLTHTSGPWIACSGNAGEHFNIECKGPDNDLYPVATLKGPDRKANALLLAAAPDLLDSLLRALAVDSPSVKWTREEMARSRSAWREEALAAIAKAKGNTAA